MDFIHDRDDRDRPLKWLSVVDEFTRECVALEVERGMTSQDVVSVLIYLFTSRGVPAHIRSDNGGEFIAGAVRRLAERTGMEMLHIAPGRPWENGYAESFHGRLRDELLNAEVFADVREAKALAQTWRTEYNHRRPHSSLGYVPAAVFAATLAGPPVGAAPLLRPGQRRTLSLNPDSHSEWYRKWEQGTRTSSGCTGTRSGAGTAWSGTTGGSTGLSGCSSADPEPTRHCQRERRFLVAMWALVDARLSTRSWRWDRWSPGLTGRNHSPRTAGR